MSSLIVRPIGYIRNSYSAKFDAPHQPSKDEAGRDVIELMPDCNFEIALRDLAGFERIWVISWFHKNTHWRPVVSPPRGSRAKRGLFATRSPRRPNPLGISAVKLLGIESRQITISSSDLLDGTPVIDIKPYIPNIDSFPESKIGWLQAVEEEQSQGFQITVGKLAAEQLNWLAQRGINFFKKASRILENDPTPHPTRRIKKYGERLFQMGCAEWRIYFTLEDRNVLIHAIHSGFSLERLTEEGSEVISNRDSQILFFERWPRETIFSN